MSIETLREQLAKTGMCPTCFNVGTIACRADQLGWLRRRDLEEKMKVDHTTGIWELPNGQIMPRGTSPEGFRAPCPVCSPRRQSPPFLLGQS